MPNRFEIPATEELRRAAEEVAGQDLFRLRHEAIQAIEDAGFQFGLLAGGPEGRLREFFARVFEPGLARATSIHRDLVNQLEQDLQNLETERFAGPHAVRLAALVATGENFLRLFSECLAGKLDPADFTPTTALQLWLLYLMLKKHIPEE